MRQHILLADNQAIFRTGVARVISEKPGYRVVVQCSDVQSLKDAAGSHRKCIVVFPSSIARNLSEVLDWIEHADSRAIVILEHGAVLDDTISERVSGIVLRSVAAEQLLECIDRVAEGQRSVQKATVKAMPAPDRVGARVVERLTPKELQIIALVTEGAKNKEIAAELGTKEQVVKNYLRSIYDKTGVSDRLELALFTVHHRALSEATDKARPERKTA